MPEIDFRRRCMLVGIRITENFIDALDQISRIIQKKTVLPVETNKKYLKSVLDSIKEDVENSFRGFGDGYPPCISDSERYRVFLEKIDEAYDHVDMENFEGAYRDLAIAREAFKLATTGVKITREIDELEYLIRKRMKGEKLF